MKKRVCQITEVWEGETGVARNWMGSEALTSDSVVTELTSPKAPPQLYAKCQQPSSEREQFLRGQSAGLGSSSLFSAVR